MSLIRQEAHAFLAAVMFFTRIRVPKWVSHSQEWLSKATLYFPVIGVIVALTGAAAFAVLHYFLPLSSFLPPIFYTIATIRVTGAFHEDGFADMCDGFGGGWTRASILRIMRDSSIGAFAGIGLILILLTKIAAVANLMAVIPLPIGTQDLLEDQSWGVARAHTVWLLRLTGCFVAAHVFGRWSCTHLLYLYKYVENSSAPGKEFLITVSLPRMVLATASTFAIVALALSGSESFWIQVIVTWTVVYVVSTRMGSYINRVIGGVIGDCLGATNQVVEICVYLTLGIDWTRVAADALFLYQHLRIFIETFILKQ